MSKCIRWLSTIVLAAVLVFAYQHYSGVYRQLRQSAVSIEELSDQVDEQQKSISSELTSSH